jgi:hypothetical protein
VASVRQCAEKVGMLWRKTSSHCCSCTGAPADLQQARCAGGC